MAIYNRVCSMVLRLLTQTVEPTVKDSMVLRLLTVEPGHLCIKATFQCTNLYSGNTFCLRKRTNWTKWSVPMCSSTVIIPFRDVIQLVDLPTVVECHKTLDNKTLYKTGDISQMLICTHDPPDTASITNVGELPTAQQKDYIKKLTCNHGRKPRVTRF